MTGTSCGSLASALKFNPSYLKKLDLSQNHLRDEGVKLLSVFVEDPTCELESLRSLQPFPTAADVPVLILSSN